MMSVLTELLGGVLVLLLVCLLTVSHVFRYYAKFSLFTCLSVISATIFLPLMFMRPFDYRNALLPAWGGRQISKLLGLQWEMRGREHIVKGSGCVVLINHQSSLDLLVLAELWPVMERCTMISKREIFYFWPFGLAAWLWGTIFINRLNGERAKSAINSAGMTIRQRQAKLCMFPEGTRNNGRQLLPFKKGAFHVAIASQTPVQPVIVSRYNFLDSERQIFNPGKSVIEILPPISTAGIQMADIGELMQTTYAVMQNHYTLLSDQQTISTNKTE